MTKKQYEEDIKAATANNGLDKNAYGYGCDGRHLEYINFDNQLENKLYWCTQSNIPITTDVHSQFTCARCIETKLKIARKQERAKNATYCGMWSNSKFEATPPDGDYTFKAGDSVCVKCWHRKVEYPEYQALPWYKKLFASPENTVETIYTLPEGDTFKKTVASKQYTIQGYYTHLEAEYDGWGSWEVTKKW